MGGIPSTRHTTCKSRSTETTTRCRHRIATGIVLALLFIDTALAGGPLSSTFEDINARATQLRQTKSIAAAETLVDSVFDYLVVTICRDSDIRERIVKTEAEFRKSGQHVVSEQQLVDAINGTVPSWLHQPWAKTTVAQVHIFRSELKRFVPALIGSGASTKSRFVDVGTSMGPTEAVFVGFYLSLGKMYDPSYQVDPDKWVAAKRRNDAGARLDPGGQRSQSVKGEFSLRPRNPFGDQADMVRVALSEENAIAVAAANKFLDLLGLKR